MSPLNGSNKGVLILPCLHLIKLLLYIITKVLLTVSLCVCTTYAQRVKSGSRTTTTTAAPNDDEFTDECPDDGFFADESQCDKYYACTNGVIDERLCPDGMVFNDFSHKHEKCDLPFGIDCSQRPKLRLKLLRNFIHSDKLMLYITEEPQPSEHCRRKNGYFQHEDAKICDKFYYCVDGKFNMIMCPDGLVYSEKVGICTWPDEAKKKGCASEALTSFYDYEPMSDVFKFTCPKTNTTGGAVHPRYPDPEDCQFFYVCINGEIPRRNGCQLGKVFNEATGNCDNPKNVPECVDWYKGVITDEELDRLNRPKPVAKTPAAGTHSRRRPSQRPSSRPAPVASHEEEEEEE
ncbi:hypothetical protein B566_EDAN004164 [Ephemera danica]|nr:hypothetical protein B566_EDAN004164 [Ephemera danica]